MTDPANKEAYDKFATYMSSKFAIKKSWLLDMQSVNLGEIFASTLGVLALFFGWKKQEKEEFANLSSSLILLGVVGANPITLIVSLASWAKTYTKNKNKKPFKEGTVKGLLGMGSFVITASLFSPLSPLLGLIIGLVVLILAKKKLKKIEVSDIYDWFRKQILKYKKELIAMGGGAGIAVAIGGL